MEEINWNIVNTFSYEKKYDIWMDWILANLKSKYMVLAVDLSNNPAGFSKPVKRKHDVGFYYPEFNMPDFSFDNFCNTRIYDWYLKMKQRDAYNYSRR